MTLKIEHLPPGKTAGYRLALAMTAWAFVAFSGCSAADTATPPDTSDIAPSPDTHDAQTSVPDISLPTPDGGCSDNTECVFTDEEGADPCLVALCVDGACIVGLSPEPEECDDGNPCTSDDGCGPNGCTGIPMPCDDGDVCTDDSCLDGSCLNLPNAVPCYDDDPCTVSDVCIGGSCKGSPRSCDDANPCTADSCDPIKGCVFSAHTSPCDDSNPCTENDICEAATCSGDLIECDDGNPCTDESCVSGAGCVYDLLLGPCDDGNPCTIGDNCGYGLCLPGALSFDDPGCSSVACGDGSCGDSESCLDCWWDCGHCCGDGYCRQELGENCATCNADCGVCEGCGDGTCTATTGEDCNTCPTDCGICDDVCVSTLSLQCGQMVAGSLLAATATDAIQDYICLESNHSGSEQGFQLKTDCDGIVHVTVEKHGGFAGLFNIFILDGELPCRGDACLSAGVMDTAAPTKGTAVASFQAWAYHSYNVVIDGAQGALGTYTLGVDCTCEIPDENCGDLLDNDLDSKTDCDDPECPAPCPLTGNACAAPFEIDTIPFQSLANTTDMTDSMSAPSECADIYAGKGAGAPDAIYRMEVPETGLYAASVATTSTDFDTIIYLLWTCGAAPQECPAAHNVPGNGGEQIFFLAKSGDERFIVVDGASASDSGSYDLNIAFYGAVEVDCSDGLDDDEDGFTDCDDPDCTNSMACSQ